MREIQTHRMPELFGPRCGFVTIALCALLAAGCKSEPVALSIEASRAFTAPPAFVGSPVAVLLTNADGFSAHLQINAASNTFVGQLIGGKNRLLFLPAHAARHFKPGPRAKHEMSFIWDVAENSGYVLSEALQGYAPIVAGLAVTNVNLQAETSPAFENINGHPCRKTEAILGLANGTTAKYNVWRATDAKRFPLRIEAEPGAAKLTINLSAVRFKEFEGDLFLPPNGFTRYASTNDMAAELVIRTAALEKPVDTRLLPSPTEGFESLETSPRNQPVR